MNESNPLKVGAVIGLLLYMAKLVFSHLLGLSTGWHYLGYLVLVFFVVSYMSGLRKSYKENDIFIKGIKHGVQLSLAAGIVVAIMNLIAFMLHPEWSFNKFGLDPSTFNTTALISVGTLLEIFIIGNLVTFIMMQGRKDEART